MFHVKKKWLCIEKFLVEAFFDVIELRLLLVHLISCDVIEMSLLLVHLISCDVIEISCDVLDLSSLLVHQIN